MSRLKVDNIETRSGNNVAMDDPLKLKGYTTAQRNALTGMVAGDTIYNSSTGTIDFYNGSSWNATSSTTFTVTISYLVIAGGGGGGGFAAGGAGGYRSSYSTDVSGANSSTESTITITPDGSTNYQVVVGAGGAGSNTGSNGSTSTFHTISSVGGGRGNTPGTGNSGGSGAGGGSSWTASYNGGSGTASQGMAGGRANHQYNHDLGGGGGGAGAAGTDSSGTTAGSGGDGLASSITGSSVYRAGGGGGRAQNGTNGSAGQGQGTNTGGGGSPGSSGGNDPGDSGVVIIRYNTAKATINIGAGLVSSTATDGSDTVVTFTGGSGNIQFS